MHSPTLGVLETKATKYSRVWGYGRRASILGSSLVMLNSSCPNHIKLRHPRHLKNERCMATFLTDCKEHALCGARVFDMRRESRSFSP